MSSSTITTGNFPSSLWPGIRDYFSDWKSMSSPYKQIFTTLKSDKSVEVDLLYQGTPEAPTKAEGAATDLVGMGQAFYTTYKHITYSIGLVMTRDLIMDNQYPDEFPHLARNLKTSLMQATNTQAANVFNNAFDANHPIGDGAPLCGNHPMANGDTLVNYFANPTQLSESAVKQAYLLIQKYRNDAGILMNYRPEKLIIGPENEFPAEVLTRSKYRTGTGNNDINPVESLGIFPKGYVVNNYFSNPYAWFIQTDCPVGFKHYERYPLTFNVHTDYSTQNVITTATLRQSFGCSNPRAVFGSAGA